MKPWKHFIPKISSERSPGLNVTPIEHEISYNGQQLARFLGSTELLDQMFQDNFIIPLSRVIDEFVSLPNGSSWKEAVVGFHQFTLCQVSVQC